MATVCEDTFEALLSESDEYSSESYDSSTESDVEDEV